MQTKLSLCVALLSAISLVTAEPTPQPAPQDAATPTDTLIPTVTINSKFLSDAEGFLSSITAAPEWPSYSSVIYDVVGLDLTDLLGETLTDITAEPGYTDLPDTLQSFIVSVKNAEQSLITKEYSGAAPKPTGAVVMAAGAAAAGLVGFAAML